MSRNFLSSPRRMALLPVLTGMFFGLTLSLSAQTASSEAAPRILGPVNSAAMTTLKGNTLSLAKASNDHGRIPDATPTGRLLLQLKPSAAQQAALDKLVLAQQDPKSSSFHKWLTPASYGQQFGASDADIQTVSAYLSQQGFSVSRVLPSKLGIEFSGTTGQLRSSFKTEIHSFTVKGQTFNANDRDPQIPTALTSVVQGFSALNNYSPASKVLTSQRITVARKGKKVKAQYSDESGDLEAVSPGDIAQIYDIPSSATGSGVTIGLVGRSNINLTYYQNYRSTFVLGSYTPAVIIDGDDPGIGADSFADLAQLELTSAVAPSAKINYYTSASSDLSTGLNFSLIRAINDDAVQVLILNQENCEANLGIDDNYFLNNAGEFAAALGMTVVAKSGNGGSAECDSGGEDGSATPSAASHGLAVSGYASSPYVTAVGATDFFYPVGDRNEAYLLTCCWNADNSGTAGYTSAKGYIPEQPWNDSNGVNNGEPFPAFTATGGGVSTLGGVSADGTTSIPYPEPTWQIPVVPAALSGGARVVPDVSMFGGDADNGSIYMACVEAGDCVGGDAADDTLVYGYGAGTESSAAVFGGVAGLIVAAHGPQGNINPTLYSMYAKYPQAFHDVTEGTNTVTCNSGTPNCGSDGFIDSSAGADAYSATSKYDAASGLGSVDVGNLITYWTVPNTAASTTTLSLTAVGTSTPLTSFVHGSTAQINIAVAGGAVTPTGDVSLIAATAAPANTAVTYFTLDATGKIVDTQGAAELPGGTYQVKANYGGDSTYAASVSAPVTLTVSPETSQVKVESMSFTAGSAVAYGTPVSVHLNIFSATNNNSIGTATGAVTVTDFGSTLTTVPLDSQGYATFNGILPAGSHSLGFSYPGDASYQSSSLASALNLSVNAQGTSTSLSSTNSNDGKGDYAQLVALVSATSTPTGTITWPAGTITFQTLGANAKTLGTITVVPTTNSSGQLSGVANFQVKGANLPNSPTLISATYTPASTSNYSTSLSNILSVTTTSAAGLNTSTTTVATLDGSASYFDYTGSVTLNVTETGGGATPTGSVSIYDNGTLLGTSTLTAGTSSSTASYTINQDDAGYLPVPIGRNEIVVQYNGDSTHATSTKALPLNILDEGVLPDFSLQTNVAYGTLSATVSPADFTLQLTSINNFAALGQKVTFDATVPNGITCTFGAKNVTFGATTNFATNSVSCSAANGYTIATAGSEQRPLNKFWIASGGATLACVFLLGLPGRRREWRSRIGMLMLILGVGISAGLTLGMTGCGSNAAASSALGRNGLSVDAKTGVTAAADKVLAPGIYQVVITATAPFATKVEANTATLETHSIPLQIVVQ